MPKNNAYKQQGVQQEAEGPSGIQAAGVRQAFSLGLTQAPEIHPAFLYLSHQRVYSQGQHSKHLNSERPGVWRVVAPLWRPQA